MVNLEAFRTIPGILNVVQVICCTSAIIANSVFYEKKIGLFWQVYYDHYPVQIIVQIILFFTFVFSIFTLVCNLTGRDLVSAIGKMKVTVVYGVFVLLLIASGSLCAYNAHRANSSKINDALLHDLTYYGRFVAVAVFNWLLVIAYLASMVLTIIYG